MFSKDFAWGVADSAYQIEGRDPQDGCGRIVWDTFCEEGKVYEGQNAQVACDHIHRYKEDFALMRMLGVKNYRFSLNWARILPEGIGRVNQAGIDYYKDMLREIRANGIEPYLTLFHWEYPQALQDKGGWLNPESVQWFGEYAKVVAENFSEDCQYFFTLNEPQCFVGLGHLRGEHAPGLKLSYKDTFQIAHNVLKAHGQAVINLRQYAKVPVKVGFAPTCGVAIPATDSPEDIAAARETYFGLQNSMDNWTWNVAWYSDPVFLGHYPQEGLKRFAEYLPEITPEDMELISQPLDFMGQNVYNGYVVRRGADGGTVYVDRYPGFPKTAIQWPVTPECIYWSCKFLYERYHMPIYITENGISCHDTVSLDGKVHDPNRIDFLEKYLYQVQRATDEGVDIRGYFLWTFLDNFEWANGYHDRFGLVYVDYRNQQRIVKDSAYWYKNIMETNGAALAMNRPGGEILYLEPVLKECVWGGRRLVTEFPYQAEGDAVGECWAISAHPHGDCRISQGKYAGQTLSKVYREHKEMFGNLSYEEFPLLVKIIDAKSDLSIQVHPDDSYAREVEKVPFGKTECWYIMDCDDGAELVVGHHARTREELKQMIADNRYEELIRRVPVGKGDMIQINPGTVHAITGSFLILETQQNSDITYRVYDYNRLVDGKPRQLHVSQSIDVINVPDEAYKKAIKKAAPQEPNTWNLLTESDYYKVWKLVVKDGFTFNQEHPFLIVSVLEGVGIIEGHSVGKGAHLLIPAGYGQVEMLGDMEIIASTAAEKSAEA